MDRRLQLLLDQDRYQRVADEAAKTGESVAKVIRNAIDLAYPDRSVELDEAWDFILTFPQLSGERAYDIEELTAGFEPLEGQTT